MWSLEQLHAAAHAVGIAAQAWRSLVPQAWARPGVCRVVCPPRRLTPRIWTPRDVARVARYASLHAPYPEIVAAVLVQAGYGARVCDASDIAGPLIDQLVQLHRLIRPGGRLARLILRGLALLARLFPRASAVFLALTVIIGVLTAWRDEEVDRLIESIDALRDLCNEVRAISPITPVG